MEKSKGETRGEDVLQRMRSDIISCELRPGQKLRFEALRDRYSVSFSTLREALSRLAAEELVQSEGQRGFVVSPISITDLEDLTNVRVLIEKEALGLSMKYGDDEWEAGIISTFHRMDRLQQRLGEQYYLNEQWSGIHGQFHFSLVSACRSPNLLQLRQKLFERAHRYRRISSQFRTQWRPKEVEHKMIMEATLDRTDKAKQLIEQHIRETTRNVIDCAAHLFTVEAQEEAAA